MVKQMAGWVQPIRSGGSINGAGVSGQMDGCVCVS